MYTYFPVVCYASNKDERREKRKSSERNVNETERKKCVKGHERNQGRSLPDYGLQWGMKRWIECMARSAPLLMLHSNAFKCDWHGSTPPLEAFCLFQWFDSPLGLLPLAVAEQRSRNINSVNEEEMIEIKFRFNFRVQYLFCIFFCTIFFALSLSFSSKFIFLLPLSCLFPLGRCAFVSV